MREFNSNHYGVRFSCRAPNENNVLTPEEVLGCSKLAHAAPSRHVHGILTFDRCNADTFLMFRPSVGPPIYVTGIRRSKDKYGGEPRFDQ
jgi:hypothetical protein